MVGKMKKVSIIIPTYNGLKVLKKCLESLKKTDYKNLKIILVDNGSSDGTISFIKKNYPSIEIIALNKNYGFAYAVNKGIKKAIKDGSDYILSLNNDVIIPNKNWIRELIKTAEKDNKIGIIGIKITSKNKRLQFLFYGLKSEGELDKGQYDFIREVPAINGVAMFIKKEVIKKVGFFDERFFYGRDDLDYGFRARKAGFKVIYNGKIKLIHYGGYSFKISKGKESLNLFKEKEKGLLLFSFKHLNLKSKILAVLRVFIDVFISKENNKKISIKNIRFNKDFLKRLYYAFLSFKETIFS